MTRSETTTRSFTTVATVISVLIVEEALTLLIAALLHLGVPVPLGCSEPRISEVCGEADSSLVERPRSSQADKNTVHRLKMVL